MGVTFSLNHQVKVTENVAKLQVSTLVAMLKCIYFRDDKYEMYIRYSTMVIYLFRL